MGVLENLQRVTKNIWQEEPMKKHTTFQIGGPADFLIVPEHPQELVDICRILQASHTPYFFMGNGSNLLVSDKGYRGAVVKTTRLCDIAVQGTKVSLGCGVMMPKAASVMLQNSLAGFEALSGIPGTVGGAVCMNAGAYGSEMRDVVLTTDYFDGAEIKTISGSEHEFSYRHSFYSNKPYCILTVTLQMTPGISEEIRQKTAEYTQSRVSKQPLHLPSAGSTFKRPEGYYAAKLIEECGLKGKRIGDACVSEKHSGFLVNLGQATCDDMLRLMDLVKEEVFRQFHVELEPEIKIVPEDWQGVLA